MKTIQCAHPPHHLHDFGATCPLWTGSGAFDALLVLYMYYALHFALVEHSLCHELISVSIDVFVLLA